VEGGGELHHEQCETCDGDQNLRQSEVQTLHGSRNDGRPGVNSNADDVAFALGLIDHMIGKYKVDAGRACATGMSNGAQFTYRLACELADKIAAISPVGSWPFFEEHHRMQTRASTVPLRSLTPVSS